MFEVDRTRRVAELIKRELAVLIARELNDNRINSVSITAVTVTRDLMQSVVYFSTISDSHEPQEIEKLLTKSSGYLRHLLSQKIDLRTTPKLVFKYDDSIQRGVEMTQLIDKLSKEDAA
jgi:ribosome-binding factor A